ncbi:CG10417 [Drosophila busckii]|uniref:protein-serine/threonine phosphatase n=1 Tax=Drosophila busckii TaxID=30019 RepID=A0A0M3QUI4_DROBS|nr:probable protein phosphatase CG10417 [Drosophila busckii]ALC40683.1 CG10417 [Drosophila busckii]
MGAYLTQPKTDKASTDEFSNTLVVGASSMQGWRNSQEDAHNSILNFDLNTSFFAVYDGHGGAEVAQYCADKLPEYLKGLNAYKRGQFEQALKDAFLGFDKTLLDPIVVTTLKILAGEHNIVDDEADGYTEEDDDEDLAELHEESNLPLNEVLGKYKGLPQTHDLSLLKAETVSATCLRGRRAAAVAAEAVNKAVMDPKAKPSGSSTSAAAATAAFSEIDGMGPSCSKAGKQEPEDESTVSSSSTSRPFKTSSSNTSHTMKVESTVSNAPKSTIKGVGINEQNGKVTSSEAKAVINTDEETLTAFKCAAVSESTDAAVENTNSLAALKNMEPFDITSTSKESNKVQKKMSVSHDEDSTDDDADFDENAIIEAHEITATDSSTDDDMDEDTDCPSEDEDDIASEDEADEDQLANEQFCANMIEEPGKDSGCTAVVSLLHGRDLYVANAGDSRCVISRAGKAIEMSLDHKPEDEEESTRIARAGGRVTHDGRVNGGLNLSRALGDHAYKMNLELPAESQMISALPDVKKLIITPEDEFMVLACDGIWNYMSSEEVVDFVRLRLNDENKKLSQICEELFDNCLAPNTMGDGTGCDNMTAVIVKFEKNLQELPTSIDSVKTKDVLITSHLKAEGITLEQKVLKRSASPDGSDNDKNVNKSKRLKTEETMDNKEKNCRDGVSSTPSSDDPKDCIAHNSGNESAVVVSSS